MLLQDSPVLDMNYVSKSVFEKILTLVLEERFPEIESLTEHQRRALVAVINRKDAILPTGYGKLYQAAECLAFRLTYERVVLLSTTDVNSILEILATNEIHMEQWKRQHAKQSTDLPANNHICIMWCQNDQKEE